MRLRTVLKQPAVIVVAAIICVIAGYVYFASQPPPGVESKGPEVMVAWISLAVAIVSLLTSVVGLLQKLAELLEKRQPKS